MSSSTSKPSTLRSRYRTKIQLLNKWLQLFVSTVQKTQCCSTSMPRLSNLSTMSNFFRSNSQVKTLILAEMFKLQMYWFIDRDSLSDISDELVKEFDCKYLIGGPPPLIWSSLICCMGSDIGASLLNIISYLLLSTDWDAAKPRQMKRHLHQLEFQHWDTQASLFLIFPKMFRNKVRREVSSI